MKNNKIKIALLLTLFLFIFSSAILAADNFGTAGENFEEGKTQGKYFYRINNRITNYNDAFREYTKTDDYKDIESKINHYDDFKDGFLRGYEEASRAEVEVKYGKSFGESLGRTSALEDVQKGRDSDWKKAIPSDKNIIRMYKLDDLPDGHSTSFIKEFKDAFEETYNKVYEEELLNPPKMDMEQGLQDGNEPGKELGALAAKRDYLYKKTMNSERDLLNDWQIREKYRLNLRNDPYGDAFIQSFKKEYKIAYNETFRSLSNIDSLLKSVSTTINQEGGDFGSGDLSINLKPGSFYLPIMVTINTRSTELYNMGIYNRASVVYGIQVDNPQGSLNDKNNITISFPFYADNNKSKAGIYKLTNDRWSYIPSKVEGNTISAEVLPSTLSNRESIFAVFIDNNIRVLTDVRDHWAKEEIETMVRRNIITGYPGKSYLDGVFKPEQPVTRAEFLILLSRTENWTLPNYITNASYFKDYQQFQSYGSIISYGLSKGYIYGYTDRTFRPYNPISYYEVELIMARVLNQYNFKWNTIADQIMYDKNFKSSSYQNINRKITRAEVSYMLYILNQWRY